MDVQTLISLAKTTFSEWREDRASRLAAALAYYTVFSLAPLLVIAISVIGWVLGNQDAARQEVLAQIQSLIGSSGREAAATLIENASRPGKGIFATVVGVVVLLLGASGVFGQLEGALNTVWEVRIKPGQGIWKMIRKRFLSFTMVLGTGFLLLVSLLLSAALAAANKYFTSILPGADFLWQVLHWFISFGLTTLLFAVIFKVLPDVIIKWRDVWVGATITALLFSVGKFLIGLYLGNSATGSAFGAAGAFAVLLVWIYYSAQILLLGAEFTQVYALRHGSQLIPKEGAILLSDDEEEKPATLASEDRTASAPLPASEPHTHSVTPVNVLEPQSDAKALRDRTAPSKPWASIAVFGLVLGVIVGLGRLLQGDSSS